MSAHARPVLLYLERYHYLNLNSERITAKLLHFSTVTLLTF
jgi:hypothetical protein